MKKNLFRIFQKYFSKVFNFIYKEKSPKLPEILFLLGTAYFPQLNVELIIRDSEEKTLFIWRDDEFGNVGWHLPGGIIRPNEKILKRVEIVLDKETNLKSTSVKITGPISFSEVIHNLPGIRSHFNSFVYLVELKDKFNNYDLDSLSEKFLLSQDVPKKIIKNHTRYIPLLKKNSLRLRSKSINIAK